MSSSYKLPSVQSLPYTSFNAFNITNHNSSIVSDDAGASNAIGSSYNCGDKMVFQKTTIESCYPWDPEDANDLFPKTTNKIHLMGHFGSSLGSNKVWRSLCVEALSTSDQPYLLDQMLAGYREVSRTYTFSTEEKSGSFPGLLG
ncbi:hypothetical protein ACOSP7_006224 [Xanthoceras sorbifolium]